MDNALDPDYDYEADDAARNDGLKTCVRCLKRFDPAKGEIAFREHPFLAEVNDDHTPCWICDDCVQGARDDI